MPPQDKYCKKYIGRARVAKQCTSTNYSLFFSFSV